MEKTKFTGVVNDKTYDNATDFYKAFIEAKQNNNLKNVQYNYNYESESENPNQLDMFEDNHKGAMTINPFEGFDVETYLDNMWCDIADTASKEKKKSLVDNAVKHLTDYFESLRNNPKLKEKEIDTLIEMMDDYNCHNDDLQSQINNLEQSLDDNCFILEIINKLLYNYNELEPKCQCEKKGYDTRGCQCTNKESETPKYDFFKELDKAFKELQNGWKDCVFF